MGDGEIPPKIGLIVSVRRKIRHSYLMCGEYKEVQCNGENCVVQ